MNFSIFLIEKPKNAYGTIKKLIGSPIIAELA